MSASASAADPRCRERNRTVAYWWSRWDRRYRATALNSSGAADQGADDFVDLAAHFDQWVDMDWSDLPGTVRATLVAWAVRGSLL